MAFSTDSTPHERLQIVRAEAQRVLGTDRGAEWMRRTNPAVLEGTCILSLACISHEGFSQALAELGRLAAGLRRTVPQPADAPIEPAFEKVTLKPVP